MYYFSYILLVNAINSDDPNTYAEAKMRFQKSIAEYEEKYRDTAGYI